MTPRKNRHPEHLKIQLGLKCNFRCGYCLQRGSVGQEEKTSLEDVEAFLDSLSSWLQEAPARIEFWGGEPLLYEAKLKKLVPALRVRFPQTQFYLATNGSLINREWIDFFDRHDVVVAISHDGPAQITRGPDPLEKPAVREAIVELVQRRPKSTCLSYVLTPQSYDLFEIERWFRQRLPGVPLPLNVEGVVRIFNEEDARRFSFDDATGEKLAQAVSDRIVAPGGMPFLLKLLVQVYLRQTKPPSRPVTLSHEERDPRCLTVDLKGQVLANHNFSRPEWVLGHVLDWENLKTASYLPPGGRAKCATCPVLATCRTPAFFAGAPHEEENCRNLYYFHLGVLAGASRLQAAMVETEVSP